MAVKMGLPSFFDRGGNTGLWAISGRLKMTCCTVFCGCSGCVLSRIMWEGAGRASRSYAVDDCGSRPAATPLTLPNTHLRVLGRPLHTLLPLPEAPLALQQAPRSRRRRKPSSSSRSCAARRSACRTSSRSSTRSSRVRCPRAGVLAGGRRRKRRLQWSETLQREPPKVGVDCETVTYLTSAPPKAVLYDIVFVKLVCPRFFNNTRVASYDYTTFCSFGHPWRGSSRHLCTHGTRGGRGVHFRGVQWPRVAACSIAGG